MANAQISELMYVPEAGRDMAFNTEIDFDPLKYKTKEAAAKALGEALVQYAINSQGYSEDLARGEISVWPRSVPNSTAASNSGALSGKAALINGQLQCP